MADDTLAVLTRVEAYEAINDATSANAGAADRDHEIVDMWVPAISRRIDDLCGPVVVRTVTAERHDGGGQLIELRQSPALTITTVTEYWLGTPYVLSAEQDATLPTYGYLIDRVGASTFLVRRSAGLDCKFATGRQNIKVTYQAGRYATTATVDPKFKLAAASVLVGMWSKYGGAWARGGDPFAEGGQSPQFFDELTHNVKRWLADELLPPASA
jgi:hypothetical protein